MILEHSQTLILASLALFSNQLNFSASGSFLIFLVLACLSPPHLILTTETEWVLSQEVTDGTFGWEFEETNERTIEMRAELRNRQGMLKHPETHNGGMPSHCLPRGQG